MKAMILAIALSIGFGAMAQAETTVIHKGHHKVVIVKHSDHHHDRGGMVVHHDQ
jgi:hypothetical protein